MIHAYTGGYLREGVQEVHIPLLASDVLVLSEISNMLQKTKT